MSRYLIVALLGAIALSAPAPAQDGAGGTKPVTSGPVIRGITLANPGNPGSKTGTDCTNFADEKTGPDGNMDGASVQCRPDGSVGETLRGLPDRFNAYCVFPDASRLGGARLIAAPLDDNRNHCDLSAMTPKDAQRRFGGAIWCRKIPGTPGCYLP